MSESLKQEAGAALGICATIIGAGFASGREIVSFFSQFGAAGWLGVPAAGACIAWIVYLVLSLARSSGADSLPAMYGRLFGRRGEAAIHLLHGLLCLMTAAAMLSAGGELFALALPMRRGRAAGTILTLALALLFCGRGMRALSVAGAVLLPALLIYYLLCARGLEAGGSDVSIQSLLLCVPMGVLYASFNGALCAGTIALSATRAVRPGRCALYTGLMLSAVLAAGNAAMLRAGGEVRALALPSVALAARQWGGAGFYVSAGCILLAVLTTLAGMLLSLQAQAVRLLPRKPALCILLPALFALLLSAAGFEALVGKAYPLLGWLALTVPGRLSLPGTARLSGSRYVLRHCRFPERKNPEAQIYGRRIR